ncbi:MAG: SET domain-containing protein [Nanoarchaeota archaeon]
MLLVKTHLDKSKVQGIGLFADEFIPKGTLIWKFVSGFDFALKKENLNKLPEVAKSWVLHYGYYNEGEGGHVICVDNGRFMNHSENSNTTDTNIIGTIAIRDIKKGEEITCNYFEFDAGAQAKLARSD